MPAGTSYWIQEGMLAREIYNADVDGDGRIDHVFFKLKDKFLHPNHPIGWVKKIGVCIDGEMIDPERICFVLRGQWIPLKYMPTIRDIWWHMLEDACIYIRSNGLEDGRVVHVRCDIDISLLVHTQNLDSNGIFPCLHCSLDEDMSVQKELQA